MAFLAGDRCRVKLSSGVLSVLQLQPQPPRLGVVQFIEVMPMAGNVHASFENGLTLEPAGVVAAALDKLTDPTPTDRDVYIDKMAVGIKTPASSSVPEVDYSAEFIGKVVDVYLVDPGATGNTSLRVLIETTPGGMFYELGANNVRVLGNR